MQVSLVPWQIQKFCLQARPGNRGLWPLCGAGSPVAGLALSFKAVLSYLSASLTSGWTLALLSAEGWGREDGSGPLATWLRRVRRPSLQVSPGERSRGAVGSTVAAWF